MVHIKTDAPALQDPLWLQLRDFPLDQVDASYPFSLRLARENRWSHRYALQVCDEYKRFLFLAMKSGHMVTPSIEVDQAWHLHLIYTRSYWNELCHQILGKPLHHGPTKGGAQQEITFIEAYEATQRSYQQWFGDTPPPSIWPPASERFRAHAQWRWIDVSRHWLLPRPSLRHSIHVGIATLALLIAACGQQVGLFPVDALFAIMLLFFLLMVTITVVAATFNRNSNNGHNHTNHSSGNSDSGFSSGCSSSHGHSHSSHTNNDNSSSCSSDSGCSSSGCGSSGCSSSGCGGGGCGGGGD